MWDKIKAWCKTYLPWVVAGAAAVAGFFIGRGRRGGAHPDIEQLRADNEELREQVRSLRGSVDQLRQLDTEHRDELEELEIHLAEAERAAKLLRAELERGGDDIGELGETNDRLREYIDKYGARLRQIADDQ